MWKTLSIIASVLLAGAGAVAHLKKQDIAEARNDLQKAQENEASLDTQIDEVEKNLEAAKADLEAAKQKSEADRATLADLEENVANLKVDLEDKDAEKAAVESELSDMEEKIAVVGQIEELKTVITQLQAEKNAAEGKVANLKSQLNGAIAEKDSTDAALSKLKTEELDKASGRMRANFTSRVSSVDPSWRYITINQGDNQGVVKDAVLDVIRGGETIGKVQVSNVEPSRSAANVVPGSFVEGSNIRPGDTLRVSEESKSKAK